jgi:hypothetical protein
MLEATELGRLRLSRVGRGWSGLVANSGKYVCRPRISRPRISHEHFCPLSAINTPVGGLSPPPACILKFKGAK